MEPRYLHRLFYVIAAIPWLLVLLTRNPSLILALACISVVSLAGADLVRTARREAELGIVHSPWTSTVEDALTDDLRRAAGDHLIKAIEGVELVGRRLGDALKSSEEPMLDAEIQRQLMAWLDLASRDLAQARAKLNELSAGAS